MPKDTFSMKEVVIELRDEIKDLNTTLSAILPDHAENTSFRKKAMYAIVGTAFTAMASLGILVLKVTGILKI